MPRFDFYTNFGDDVEDIILDENGEFRFTNTIQESLSQRISHRLNVWQGEWGFNLSYGTPYRQRFLGSALDKTQLDAEVVRVLSEEEDITSISEVVSSINKNTRQYSVKQVRVFCNDEELTIPVSSPQIQTNTYPEPRTFEDFQICGLGDATLQDINDLYGLINFSMGWKSYLVDENVGTSTWWNKWSGGSGAKVLYAGVDAGEAFAESGEPSAESGNTF